MELDGSGWSWMEVGARFSNTHNQIIRKFITFQFLLLSILFVEFLIFYFDFIFFPRCIHFKVPGDCHELGKTIFLN